MAKIKQYPPQSKKYKYLLKIQHEQTTHSWVNFSMARLQISVGKEYHEGDKMLATIDWLKPRFEKIEICVDDTLQRFNIMFEKDMLEEEAIFLARQAGIEWVERYKNHFLQIQNLNIVHWDTWYYDPRYKENREKVDFIYRKNDEFKNAIEENIHVFWQRRKNSSSLYDQSRFKKFYLCAREYLLEETAIFSMMFEKEKAIDIYPGTVVFSVTQFQGKFLEGGPIGLGKGYFCRIGFSHNKSFLKMEV